MTWLKEHLAAVQTFGQEGTRVLVRVLIGMVIGALVALRQADPPADYRPLALALAIAPPASPKRFATSSSPRFASQP